MQSHGRGMKVNGRKHGQEERQRGGASEEPQNHARAPEEFDVIVQSGQDHRGKRQEGKIGLDHEVHESLEFWGVDVGRAHSSFAMGERSAVGWAWPYLRIRGVS